MVLSFAGRLACRPNLTVTRSASFGKLLVANRGEIACRVMRTASRLGMKTVAIYSSADAEAKHVRMADEAIRVGTGPSASDSYLRIDEIVRAVRESGADAVHPGYGFLSENAGFAKAIEEAGAVFVGPPVSAIEAMGDKLESKKIAKAAGVSVIPGSEGAVQNAEEAREVAKSVGYPAMLKASAGGGGKGMRVAHAESEVEEQFMLARDEARRSFGDDRILVEKFVQRPRHIEIQLIADTAGNVACFAERECSVQRRNQKVVEESPSCAVDPALRLRMQREAAMLASAVGYHSAGTVEMLLDDLTKDFYFLEMNTRLQVEHPVTEAVSRVSDTHERRIDLVEEMLNVAQGRTLSFASKPFTSVAFAGWAFEARVYAENASRGFSPSTGVLGGYREPRGATEFEFGDGDLRVDSGVEEGSDIGIWYDPMIAKLTSFGDDREKALARLETALEDYRIEGLDHNAPFLRDVAAAPSFRSGSYTTAFIEETYPLGYAGDAALLSSDENSCLAITEECRAWLVASVCELESAEKPILGDDVVVLLAAAKYVEAAYRVKRSGKKLYSVQNAASSDGIDWIAVDATDLTLEGPEGGTLMIAGNGRLAQSVGGYPSRDGYDHALRYRGLRLDAVVLTPNEHLLRRHMIRPTEDEASKAGPLRCPMPGVLVAYAVKVGDVVHEGDALATVEAMKMANVLRADHDGTVSKLCAAVGGTLGADDVILEFEKEEEKAS